MMKWPSSVMFIRHDTSAYNVLRDRKMNDPLYVDFLKARELDIDSETTRQLALKVQEKFALGISDAETPLVDPEGKQAYQTGLGLECHLGAFVPDVIFVSPYLRARKTLEHITRGWPVLKDVKVYQDDRVREQEHGLALIYNDWKVFEVLHPDQRRLRAAEGPYWYRYPQGENVPDVRDRNRSLLTTFTRDFAGKGILVVTHHLNILATRCNLERLDHNDFIRLDEEEKPINCGLTFYIGNAGKGSEGRLELSFYNKKYYD